MDGVTSRKKPLIGVTGPDKGGFAAWIFTRWAVKRAGGRPLWMRPAHPHEDAVLDGLIIGGGADVDPEKYGESREDILQELKQNEPTLRLYLAKLLFYPFLFLVRWLFSLKRTTTGMDKDRDKLEFAALGRAVEHGIPVLGICRGAQLINIFFGGSLYQDLSGFYAETPQIRSVFPKKTIRVLGETRLHDILGTGTCRVNALHRQAIKEVGSGIRIAAREPNGVVQAVEHADSGCIIGVQWHPEFLPQHSRQRRLFTHLIHLARGRAGAEPDPCPAPPVAEKTK
ncbi:MAG: gamma-glutamyl-gamma-aminobutyrate hydrolase family protein [Desulfovibrionales bacterium]